MIFLTLITAASLLPVIAGYNLQRDYFAGGSGNFFNNFQFENVRLSLENHIDEI